MLVSKFDSIKQLSGPVLISGHTGFKGTWLTFMLEKLGIPTCGYSLAPEEKSLYNISNRKGMIREIYSDIRDFEALDNFIKQTQPSLIIHLAAQPLVLESYNDPKLTFETNVLGTLNVLESGFNCDSVKSVLVATTDKVYRNTKKKQRFRESDPLEGSDPYSSSKVAVEAVAKAWQKIRSTSSGPSVLIARAGNVIGGGDYSKNRLVPDLINGFSNNEDVIIRNSVSTRPWQHVIDPLYGYLCYLEESLKNDTKDALNFGPIEKSKSVREFVQIAQKTWGYTTNIKFENSNLSNESVYLDIDPSLALATLNWKPRWTQEQAIVNTINWWKKVLIEKVSPIEVCMEDIESYAEQNE
jgi:CDP-glucose 4,6-dehydratase